MFKVIASRRLVVIGSLFAIFSSLAAANTFTVTSANATGAGSLYQAINDANANPGADVIQFNIPGSAPFVINNMPDVSLTEAVTIDGTSQPGYNGAPLIEIRGDTDGEQIDVNSSGCTISGLSFTEQFKSVVFWAPNAIVRDCYFGLKPDGVTQTECQFGVEVESSYGVVGPNNVFVGTTDRPLDIDNGAHHNSVIGNTFGLDASGNNSLVVPTGMLVMGSDNTIGGDDAGSRNVINYRDYGIRIFGDRNVVKNNWVGFDKPGLHTFGFPNIGIFLQSGSNNAIGTPGAPPNLIIGNNAVWVDHAFNTTLQNNWVGFNTQGVVTMNRPSDGIYIRNGSAGTQIGGSNAGARNFVGNFNNNGIHIEDSSFTTIQGNTIGIDPVNNAVATNHLGIRIDRSSNLIIGGSNTGEGNLISGNVTGIVFASRPSGTDQAVIKGNFIGTNAAGTAAVPNTSDGISVSYGATHISIGGPEAGAGNVVSGNGGYGIDIGFSFDSSSATNDVLVQGNRIGLAAIDGFAAMPNSQGGISNAFGVRNHYTQNSIAYTGTNGILPKISNDLGDGDAGANNGQNFPVLTKATADGTNVEVQGSLNSIANSTFTLEFFQNSVDQSFGGGPGEGSRYFASTSVTTDANGNATFDVTFPIAIAAGRFITATATDSSGNTSCFSSYASVGVPNRAPTADAGSDQTVTVPHDGNPSTNTKSVSLNGSGSSDPDNDSLTYSWSEGANVVGTTAQVTLDLQSGTHTFTLTVTDPGGLSATDSVVVTVNPEPNLLPNKPANGDFTFTVPHDGNPATNTVSVAATAIFSSDPDGDSITFKWLDSDGNVVSTSSTLNATLTSGTYTYSFVVSDPYGSSNPAPQVIHVNPEPNSAPIANAGSDQTVTVPHDGNPATNTVNVSLIGSGSDSNNDSLTYSWKEGSTAIGTTQAVTVSKTPGTYTFTLIVTDSYGASSSDDVIVTVQPEPNATPSANAGADKSITVPHDGDPVTNTVSVSLSGSGTDADHDTLSYSWMEGATPLGATQSVSVTKTPGTYTFTLTVSDTYGASSSDDIIVTVLPEANAAPVANAGPDQNVTIPHDGDPATNTFTFNLSGSGTDADNDTLTYTWSEGTTVIGTTQNLPVTKVAGLYNFTLTVSDAYGASTSDTVQVRVNPEPNRIPNQPPSPGALQTVPHDGNPATNTVTITLGPASVVNQDPDGDPLIFRWKDGSGNIIATTQQITVTLTPGIYNYTFGWSDPYGPFFDSAIGIITVNPEPNTGPTASLISTKTITVPHDGNPATNTAQTAVTASASDSNGDPLTFAWRDAANNVVSTTTTLDIPLSVGTYTFTFTATDPYGASIVKSITITVNPETNAAPSITLATSKTVAIPHDGDPATNTAQSNVTATASDSNGDAMTFAWRDAASNLLSSSTTLDVPLTVGTYVFSFTATDSYNAATTKSITITVTAEPNATPTVFAGGDKTVSVVHDGNPATNTVVFTPVGTSAADANGDSLVITWTDENSVVVSNSLAVSVTLTPGVHTLTLRATDPYGATGSSTARITVNAEPNAGPSVTLTPTKTIAIPHDGNPATNTVQSNITASISDPNGDPLTITWTDATSQVVGSGATLNIPLVAGSYTFTVTATDPYGASAARSIAVTVTAEPNSPPLTPDANVISNSVTVPHDGNPATNTANVTAFVTATDPDVDQVTFKWTDENGNVVGTNQTLVIPLTVGIHTLTATATDPYGASTPSAPITVTVFAEPNVNPVASAGSDQTVQIQPGNMSASFTLDATGSSDQDSDPLQYSWSDGVNVVGNSATLVLSQPSGVYHYTVTVTDPYGASSNASVTITLQAANHAPNAIVGPNVNTQVPHDGSPATNTAPVTLDGSGSFDPDAGQSLTYEWRDQNNQVVGTSPQVTVTLTPGSYLFTLTVTDPYHETSSAQVSVIVGQEPNAAPSVNGGADMAGAANASGQATFTINASASDQDGDSVNVVWSENGSQIGTGLTLNKTFSIGVHTLTVTATDPYGASTSDTVVVSVQYTGNFFLQPINNDGSSIFKQGSTVPVKFELTGVSAGANVAAFLYVAKITNNIVGTEMEAVSTAQADTGNQFRSGGGSMWIFNLNTKNLTAGTYQLRVDLGDGALHTVIISLKP